MIGERIRQARLAAGLSQDQVVEHLVNLDSLITKAAISKYENNKSTPNARLLLKLAQVLKVKPAYFLTEPKLDVEWLAFRRHSDLPKFTQERVKGYAERIAEQQVELQALLYPEESPSFPSRQNVTTFEQAEWAAETLRVEWKLDEHPIESLFQLVEDKGGVVIEWAEDGGKLDGLAGWGNGVRPIVVINTVVKPDRRRFNIAHELGHLVMDTSGLSEQEQEKLAHRFAGAFLVPADVARHELGSHRRNLSWAELGLLKQKYGLSMAAWIYRATDLGIITKSYSSELWQEVNFNGWRVNEPFDYVGQEEPTRLKQMTLRAVAEGIITEDHGRELCPQCFETHTPLAGKSYMSARDLLKLPSEERNLLVAKALRRSATDDVEIFEAFSEEDFDDDSAEP